MTKADLEKDTWTPYELMNPVGCFRMRGVQLYSLGDFGVSMFGRATEAYDLAWYKVKLPRQSLYLGRAKL
jgi:hypothetical protein